MKSITAIVPNYNNGIYIKRAIESLLNQKYRLNEIIVIDDSSEDESKKIIEEYAEQNKIKAIFNEDNRGVSYCRNKGIEEAKSEFLLFCDGDDWYEEDATEQIMRMYRKRTSRFCFRRLLCN